MSSSAHISGVAPALQTSPRRVLAVACGAHALHDGFTDLIYVLLPVWQTEFALSYAALGVLRMLFAGAMAGLQVPISLLAKRMGGPLLLALGTAVVGGAYLTIGLTGASFTVLVLALLVGGAGAATQHPIGFVAGGRGVCRYRRARSPGHLQFRRRSRKDGVARRDRVAAGRDAVALGVGSDRHARPGRGGPDPAAAAALVFASRMRNECRNAAPREAAAGHRPAAQSCQRGGFPLLLAIGVLDSGTRMGFLAFLPFVLRAKGADTPMIGVALTLDLRRRRGGQTGLWLARRTARRVAHGIAHRAWHRARHRCAGPGLAAVCPGLPAGDRHCPERHVVGAVWHSAGTRRVGPARTGVRPVLYRARSAAAPLRRCCTASPATRSVRPGRSSSWPRSVC